MQPLKNTLLELNENYYLRDCYLKNDKAPTQSLMKQKMGPALAGVCAKMMTPKLKVQAGLEPPMKGGGHTWYMPPKELLAGRAVLKPIKREHIENLNHKGIEIVGKTLHQDHKTNNNKEIERVTKELDKKWINDLMMFKYKNFYIQSREQQKINNEKILQAIREFELIYKSSLTKIEKILFEAGRQEVEQCREEAYQHMNERLEQLIKIQATELYAEYEEKLTEEKTRMKAEFIAQSEQIRTDTANRLHDINVEKHLTIEKLRHFLECQNLAGQVYVALKEKERCEQEIVASELKHAKKMTSLKKDIIRQDYEIKVETQHQVLSNKVTRTWKRKVCEVVKKFQLFVEYCLRNMPERAEFFINIEKLMLLQLSEVYEAPEAVSIIEKESKYKDPVPQPHAFYLFCDQGNKPQFNQMLCPKRYCSTLSEQCHVPVIVINKKCFYSACDTFEKFADKIAPYLESDGGCDADFEDNHEYDPRKSVKMMDLTKLQELKLESSIMNILQQEFLNPRGLPVECGACKIPFCFCKSDEQTKEVSNIQDSNQAPSSSQKEELATGKLKRKDELRLEREPKMESYIEYVVTNRCRCPKTVKKHLDEYLPAYMKLMSPYEPPSIPNYEQCDAVTLKDLVTRARMEKTQHSLTVEKMTKDAATQYTDVQYEALCACFSCFKIAEEIKSRFEKMEPSTSATVMKVVNASVSSSFLTKSISSFATGRTYSLRKLLGDADLEELFQKSTCDDFSSSND